jgi:transposase
MWFEVEKKQLRTRVAQETIRDWLKKYRKNGFDGLLLIPT